MKKPFSICFMLCFSVALFAQPTIVSTTPANKNVIIEDFTGNNCVYCPLAHKTADMIVANNPGRVWAINIHQGGLSTNTPDFKTEWGDALKDQYPSTGYPAGTVNRGATITTTHSQWIGWTNTQLAQPSPVNVAAEGTIDWNTRILTLLVEVYYTGSATNSANKLNVALLQSNILSLQSGTFNYIEMIENGLYLHNHALRDLLTGQWGVDVSPTTPTSFWSQTFEYHIPQHIREIPLVLEDLEILVFVAEDTKTILTGAKAKITHLNLPGLSAKVDRLREISIIECNADAGIDVTIKNLGATTISSLELAYTVAGDAPKTFVWNEANIATMATATKSLPVFQVQTNQNQLVKVEIKKINNQTVTMPSKNITVRKDLPQAGLAMTFVLATDQYASQTTYKIFNPDGTVLTEGGPWPNLPYYGVTKRDIPFVPIMTGCHKIEVYDSGGDGINANYGNGYLKILNNDKEEIYHNNGQFGSKLTINVLVDEVGIVHAITASITGNPNGDIFPKGLQYFLEGTDAVFTFSPKEGYIVKEVVVNDIVVPNSEALLTYTIYNVDQEYDIKVSFKVGQQPPGVKDVNGVTISVAPNPVNDILYVSGLYDKLEIVAVSGQIVSVIGTYRPSIDVRFLTKGIYFVKIYVNELNAVFKIVK
jgi:hypothetical protein